MSNFIKTQAKRKRELAKLDKRVAKDQKRAQRKAEQRSGADAEAPVLAVAVAAVAQPKLASHRAVPETPPARKPMTLAEAAERWKSMKVAKPTRR